MLMATVCLIMGSVFPFEALAVAARDTRDARDHADA